MPVAQSSLLSLRLPAKHQAQPFIIPAIIGFAIIISSIGAYFLYGQFLMVKQQTQQLEKEVSILFAKKFGLSSLNKAQLETQRTILVQAMPPKAAILSLMGRVKDIAVQSNVNLTQVRFSSQQTKDKTSSTYFELVADGTFYNIQLFLNKLERSLPLVVIEKGSINGTKESIKLSVRIRTFGSAIPDSLPPATTPFVPITKDQEAFIQTISGYEGRFSSTVAGRGGFSSSPVQSRPNPFAF